MNTPLNESIWNLPMIREIGWILAHFLWQGAAAAIWLAIVFQVLRHRSANARYAIACLTLLMLSCAPIVTALVSWGAFSGIFISSELIVAPPLEVGVEFSESTEGQESIQNPFFQIIQRPSTMSEALDVIWRQASSNIEPYLPVFVFFWLGGVFVLTCWRLVGWIGLQRLKRNYVTPISDQCKQRLDQLIQKMKVNRQVKMIESALTEIPLTIGWLKPVIIMPSCVVTGLSQKQLEAIIAHELAHIRRYDYLINLIQTGMETLFFYHPAIWWISSRMRLEREQICDDCAVAICGDPVSYAQALTKVEDLRHAPTHLAMAVNRGDLLSRIRRILNVNAHAHTMNRSNVWAAGSACIIVVFALIVFTQQSAESARLHPVGIFSDYTDIGARSLVSQVRYEQIKDEYNIKAYGRGSSNKGDELLFLYHPLKGSWSIEATLEWPNTPNGPETIGLMCRESLDETSRQVSMVYPGHRYWTNFSWRKNRGDSEMGGGGVLHEELQGQPVRCRLTRLFTENRFIQEWFNPRTKKWTCISDSIVLRMPDKVLVGITASSGTENLAPLSKGLARDVKIKTNENEDFEANTAGIITSGRRILPDFTFQPDSPVQVKIELEGPMGVVKVEEIPPTNWTIIDFSPPGMLISDKIIWNVPSFTGAETLTYTIAPPNTGVKKGVFHGKINDQKIIGMTTMDAPKPIGIFDHHMDFGNPTHPGDATYDPNTGIYQIKGSLDPTQISYHFAYRKIRGNFSLQAKIIAHNVNHENPKGGAGLGILDAQKTFYAIKVHAVNSGVSAVWGRDDNWQYVQLGISTKGKNGQIRISREGDRISTFYIDPTNKERITIDERFLKFEDLVFANLVVQSGEPERYTIGYFEGVDININSG